MVSITQKYAPIVFVFAIAFLMIAPLQVIDVFAAIPSTMSVAANNIQVQSYDDRKVVLTWTPVAVPGVGFYDYELQVGSNADCETGMVTYSDPHSIATIGSFYNLTPDTTYYFRLAAVNASGAGTMSDCVSQKTLGAVSGGLQHQDVEPGGTHDAGKEFAEGQSFSSGTQTFGANTKFNAGTEFAANQEFTGVQSFSGTQVFGTGTTFVANQIFEAGQSFTTGAQTFGADTHFANDTHFAASQQFGDAQSFGEGSKFGASTTFGAVNTFADDMDFSAGSHTFSAAQEFTKGSSFGENQSFGAGVGHNFFKDDMAFLAGTDFGVARTFGDSFQTTGAQNWDDDLHTFGNDPFFNGLVNFADNQAFPIGTSFVSGQTFDASEDYTFSTGMDFAGGETFGKARAFAEGAYFSAKSDDMGTFTNTFAKYMHMPPSQAFTVAQTFDEHTHFGDSTDFTGALQTFSAGTHFGDGTTFKVGQSLPADIVPSFGLMLSAFECLDAACVPADGTAYLAPGEFLTPGVDPAPILSSITKDSKSIEMDGLGFAMTFNGDVSTAGTVSIDPIDPATLVSSSEVTETSGARSINTGSENLETVGTILNISMGTASTTGTMDITVEYDESNIPSGGTEETLEVIHHTGGNWVKEQTCTQDLVNNKFTCTVSTLSPIGVGSGGSSGSSSSGSGCTQCKVLRTHGGFAINDSTYTLVKKYNDVDTNVVKTGEPVTITLSVGNTNAAPRVTSAIVYMDVFGSPANYKQSSSISYTSNVVDKVALNDRGGLWSSADVGIEYVSHPIHQTAYRDNYVFTMIFDNPMDTSHVVIETTNHYGIPEVLYVMDALKVVENEGNYTDEVELQEGSGPEVILQSTPEVDVVVEPELVSDPEPAFMSDAITSLEIILDPEPIPTVSAEPEQDMVSELAIDPEPVLGSEPKQKDFFSWLASLFS